MQTIGEGGQNGWSPIIGPTIITDVPSAINNQPFITQNGGEDRKFVKYKEVSVGRLTSSGGESKAVK